MKLKIFIFFICLYFKGSSSYTFSFNIKFPSFSWVPSIPYVPSISSIPYIRSFSTSVSVPYAQPSDGNHISIDLEAVERKAQEYYNSLSRSILEDSTLLVPELVRKHGYPCETHQVITPDGYILTMHRIPHGKQHNPLEKPKEFFRRKPVVYLQHGILASSADWVITGPGKALGYILADAGYDVWMANNRGNMYCKNHTSLNPADGEYWNFSWHEIGIYDVPSMIDYALNYTKQEQLFYIGHSQGTTVSYVMCSEKPEYNKKIKAIFSLAPIAYMTDINSPILQYIARGQSKLKSILDTIGIYQFLPHNRVLGMVGNILCKPDSILQVLCTNSLFAVAGYSNKQMNTTLLPILMKHTPAGSATKQLVHYAQEINSGEFQKFDYGNAKNKELYGSDTPPKYQLSKITTPVYLFYSRSDWLSGERDVATLYMTLPNVKGAFLIADETFNHLDYLFGIGAPDLVYTIVLNLLKSIK